MQSLNWIKEFIGVSNKSSSLLLLLLFQRHWPSNTFLSLHAFEKKDTPYCVLFKRISSMLSHDLSFLALERLDSMAASGFSLWFFFSQGITNMMKLYLKMNKKNILNPSLHAETHQA